jgi:signal-transduction protein with cAMP-binding, CBS, and nucleotidyltransferase domain
MMEVCMSYRVKDYMSRDIVTVNVGVSALEASKLMAERGIGYLIVLEDAQPTGIVTERDLVMKVMAKEKDPSKTKVSEFMSAPLITIDLDANVEDAVKTMAKRGIRRLPIIRDNIIYGVFTTRDLTKHFSKYEDRVMRDIINAQALYGTPLDLSF